MLYFDVALNLPLQGTFIYRNSDEEENAIKTKGNSEVLLESYFGRRVEVRFGNRKLTGFVVKAYSEIPETNKVPLEKIRPISRFLDDEKLLTEEIYELAKWMASYYISSVGECIFAMVPHSGKRESSIPGFSFEEDETAFEVKELSEEQKKAVEGITSSKAKEEKHFLHYLYGMTGSGKTEVFLSAAEKVLKEGKGVIYLVPEIGLTPQVVKAVARRFGENLAVIHSELTPSQKLKEWKRILNKEARVVIGARSAVFAPVPDLGLIIIDEEHDSSYKSGSSPRYHARQIAMHRCQRLQIPLVMGSATPSVESWHLMQEGRILKHCLTCRLAGGAVPEIRCVNLSKANCQGGSISVNLAEEIKKTLSEKRQVILFLNRRGFTHFFRCNSCGYELKCKNCSVSMTYHKNENRLRCHYCGYQVPPPQQCPSCGSFDVGYSGFGTEFIENEVRAKFPNARCVRIDTDSLTHKGELQEKLDAFAKGEYDILLGTQMVAKGLNFPKLQLVGVILADTALHLPDFRASERTFALITQVAGRAGRFFPDGKVIVQSYSPEREPIAKAVTGDTEGFYKSEIETRKLLSFPPFVRMLRIVFRSAVPNLAVTAANEASNILRSKKVPEVDIMGPSECPLEKVGGNWRYQIILRGKNIQSLQYLAQTLAGYSSRSDFHIEYDVDPVDLL